MKDRLAIKIIKGEEHAFELFFHQTYVRLCQFANKFLNSPEEAREVVQETFITLWENREMIDPEESLLSYLFKVVQNKCINRLRHKHVEERYVEVLRLVYSEHNDITPAESLLALELDDAIGKIVAGLPPQCRKVFELNRYDGLRYHEIAGAMDISVKTVEAHMSKALRILRDELKNYL